MNAKLFKKLETCNAEQNWEYVRDIVTIQLMGDNVFPVPYLREATCFDIGHVILKGKRSKLEKLTGVMTSSLPVGQLSDFVSVDRDREFMQKLGNTRKDTDLRLNQAYEFHESDMKHGVKKTLTVQLWGCEKWSLEFAPKPGELLIDLQRKGYKNIDRIYLITEVYYVSDVKINLTIGNDDDEYIIKGQIPIGFTLVRYHVLPDGTLGPCKKKTPTSWSAKWIKNVVRDADGSLVTNLFQEASTSQDCNVGSTVPVIGNLPNSTSVSEGTGTEELLYVIDVTDADGDSITCTIDAGGGSNKFNLRLSTDANPSWSLYTVHGETYDPGSQAVYTLDIDCAANGDTVSSTYTINIVANLPPVITNLPDSVNVSTLTASIGDNVFTVTGTDTENDQMSYSISCSPVTPACPFTILASGAIQLNADISSSTHTGYDVTVTISDDSGSGVDKILTVLYTDINNPPQIQNLGSTISVPENTALGETVVTTDCSDSDASDTLVYTMSCTPASGSTYFLINSSSGVIYTSTTSNINYEFLGGTTSFACPVTCNDGRASDTETVTLSVTNVNEAPTLSQNAYSISADEGPAGTVILAAGFNVTDEDTGDTYSFSVDCGDSTGYFSIVTGTGVLSYSTDYDVDDGTRPSSISCNMTVTDSGGITDTAPLSIIINNINDNAPVFVYTSHVWFVSLDAAVGTVVGTAAATDADIGTFGDISYTLDQSNLTAEYFEIDSAGVVKVKSSVSGLSVGVLPSIYVYASDGGGTQTQATVTVFVTTTTTTTTTQATDRCRIWDEPVRKQRNWGEYHRENYYRQMEPIRESRRPQRRPNGYQFWSTDN